MADSKTLTTVKDRKVILEFRYLNNDFCEDAKEYWRVKNKWNSNVPMNSYFLSQAVEEFIVDKDIDPVYENQPYTRKKIASNIKTNAEKIF